MKDGESGQRCAPREKGRGVRVLSGAGDVHKALRKVPGTHGAAPLNRGSGREPPGQARGDTSPEGQEAADRQQEGRPRGSGGRAEREGAALPRRQRTPGVTAPSRERPSPSGRLLGAGLAHRDPPTSLWRLRGSGSGSRDDAGRACAGEAPPTTRPRPSAGRPLREAGAGPGTAGGAASRG